MRRMKRPVRRPPQSLHIPRPVGIPYIPDTLIVTKTPDEPEAPKTSDKPKEEPSDNVPKTGDDRDLGKWLMLVSLLGMAATVVIPRKKEDAEKQALKFGQIA